MFTALITLVLLYSFFVMTCAGCTPLHVASNIGDLEMVKLILMYKPDRKRPDIHGRTPCDHASDTEVRRWLLALDSTAESQPRSPFANATLWNKDGPRWDDLDKSLWQRLHERRQREALENGLRLLVVPARGTS